MKSLILSLWLGIHLAVTANCQICTYLDVNCPAPEWVHEQKAVGLVEYIDYTCNSNRTTRFTGFLLANTSRDGDLLFLTTYRAGLNPCTGNWDANRIKNATIKFNYRSTACNNGSISPEVIELVGQHQILDTSKTDGFLLLRLKGDAPEFTVPPNLYLAGWQLPLGETRTGTIIHHPIEQLQAISFADSAYTYGNIKVKNIRKTGNDIFIQELAAGRLDEHSLGAPLFYEDYRVRGLLTQHTLDTINACDARAVNIVTLEYLFRTHAAFREALDPLHSWARGIPGGYRPATPARLTENDLLLQSPTGQAQTFYWPNKPWQANQLSQEECPTLPAAAFFSLIKDPDTQKGLLGSVLAGEGEITLKVYAYAQEVAQYESDKSVKGPLLYACKATKSSTTFQEIPLEEVEWTYSLDIGKAFAYLKVVDLLAQHLGAQPNNIYHNAVQYVYYPLLGHVLATGLFTPLNTELLKRSRKSTQITSTVSLLNSFPIYEIRGTEEPFRKKFQKDIPILIELTVKYARCNAISIPGLGTYNAVELLQPDRFNIFFPESHSTVRKSSITAPEPLENQIKVYPNPAQEQLTIEFESSQSTPTTIRLTQLDGRLVFQQTTTLKTGTNQVVVANLKQKRITSGLYLLIVKTERGVVVKKVAISQ